MKFQIYLAGVLVAVDKEDFIQFLVDQGYPEGIVRAYIKAEIQRQKNEDD